MPESGSTTTIVDQEDGGHKELIIGP